MRIMLICLTVCFCAGCFNGSSSIKVVKKHAKSRKRQPGGSSLVDSHQERDGTSLDFGNLSNPFLSEEEQERFSALKYREPLGNRLSAVFYTGATSKAVIDGDIYTVGDLLDGKRIVEITPDEVILKEGESEYVITLEKIYSNE